MENANVALIAAAVAVLVAAFAVGSLRWHGLLQNASLDTTLNRTARAYFLGLFASNFLPSSFGGDAARAWVVAPRGDRLRAAATVLVDRATILGCAVVTAGGFLAIDRRAVPAADKTALAVSAAAVLLGMTIAALVSRGAISIAARRMLRVESHLRALWSGGRACIGDARAVAIATTLGIAYELLTILSVWIGARSLHIAVSLVAIAVVVPPVLILSALPISIGGLGVREASYASLLAPFGVATSDATVLSLMATFVFALASTPGAFLLFGRDWRSARARDLQDDQARTDEHRA